MQDVGKKWLFRGFLLQLLTINGIVEQITIERGKNE